MGVDLSKKALYQYHGIYVLTPYHLFNASSSPTSKVTKQGQSKKIAKPVFHKKYHETIHSQPIKIVLFIVESMLL